MLLKLRKPVKPRSRCPVKPKLTTGAPMESTAEQNTASIAEQVAASQLNEQSKAVEPKAEKGQKVTVDKIEAKTTVQEGITSDAATATVIAAANASEAAQRNVVTEYAVDAQGSSTSAAADPMQAAEQLTKAEIEAI